MTNGSLSVMKGLCSQRRFQHLSWSSVNLSSLHEAICQTLRHTHAEDGFIGADMGCNLCEALILLNSGQEIMNHVNISFISTNLCALILKICTAPHNLNWECTGAQ